MFPQYSLLKKGNRYSLWEFLFSPRSKANKMESDKVNIVKRHYHFPPNFPANKCSHVLLVKILMILLVNDAGHCKCQLERKYYAHLVEEEAETMPPAQLRSLPSPSRS